MSEMVGIDIHEIKSHIAQPHFRAYTCRLPWKLPIKSSQVSLAGCTSVTVMLPWYHPSINLLALCHAVSNSCHPSVTPVEVGAHSMWPNRSMTVEWPNATIFPTMPCSFLIIVLGFGLMNSHDFTDTRSWILCQNFFIMSYWNISLIGY